MDKRVGYGLTFKEAVELAMKERNNLEDPEILGFTFRNKLHDTIWGELRDDGWRVYRPKKEGETHL